MSPGPHTVKRLANSLRKQIGAATGSDYVRVFDPFDIGEQDGFPVLVNGKPVAMKWVTLSLNLHDARRRGSGSVEAMIGHGREAIRESDACILVYSCASRGTFGA